VQFLLHIGCGGQTLQDLPKHFHEGWVEFRLDINPDCCPDILSSITDMSVIEEDACFDAVYSSHNLEHLELFEVPCALNEIFRVLKPAGEFWVKVPNLELIAYAILEGVHHQPLYESPAGAICPVDMLFGHQASLAMGKNYMAHRSGFTRRSLYQYLRQAGFEEIQSFPEVTLPLGTEQASLEINLIAKKPAVIQSI